MGGQIDVTDHRETDAAFRESEEKYRVLFEMESDAIFLIDNEAGRILEVNPAASALYGYSRAELLAKRNVDLSAEPDDTRAATEAHRPRIPVRYHRKKDGTVFPVEITARHFVWRGREAHIAAIRDIGDRQRADAALVRRTRQLETVRGITAELARELDLPALLRLISSRARELLRAPDVGLFLWHGDTGRLVPAVWLTDQVIPADFTVGLGESLVGLVAAERRGRIVNAYRTWPAANPVMIAHTSAEAALAEPLLYHDTLLGVLAIADCTLGRTFTEEDADLLRLLASSAAIAIANGRAHERALHHSEQLEALLRASRTVMAGLDLQATLEQIAAEATRMTGCEQVKVVLVDREAQLLRVGVAHGRPAPPNFPCPIGIGLSGMVAQTGQPLFVADCQNDSRNASAAVDRELGFRTYLGLPIKAGDEVVGVLTFNTTEPRTYSAEEIAYLAAFAAQAAIAIANARLYEDEQRRRRELDAVRVASEELARELDLTTLLRLLHTRAMELVGADSGAVYLWDEAGQVLVPQSWQGVGPWMADVRVRPGEGVAGTAAAQQQGLFVNDYPTSPYALRFWLERSPHVAVLAEPLLYRDRLVGVITLNRQDPARPFQADDQRLLRLFAAPAAIAIENARLVAQLSRSAKELQRARDELVRAETLRALGQMAAGVAHDLNNMLAAVLGQAELLRLRVPDPMVQESLHVLETAATDGAHVVRRLQDFARQRTTSPLTPIDLAAVVREAVEITRPRWQDEAQHRGRVIEVHTDLEELPPVLGHAAEVREVLTNLIVNAVDAMPLGGRLSFVGSPAADGVLLAVADTGTGMSEAVQRQVFEPFFTTKGVKGTGLGLAVAYGIMERHQGKIQVQSAPGRGTTFTLRFQAVPKERPTASPRAAGVLAPQRVLLIDDEATVRGTIAALLRASGHTVTEADGGAAGLALLAERPVDVVLTDLGMPDLTGWDVAREVKARSPGLPVILLTGWGDQASTDAGHQKGLVARIVGKPFRLEELLRAIAEVRATAQGDQEPALEPQAKRQLP